MGVKLLHSFLKSHLERLAKATDIAPAPASSSTSSADEHASHIILVDAHGFFFSLSEEVLSRYDARAHEHGVDVYPDADVVGGDLQAVRDALMHLILRLIRVYRVQLIFAVDAPRGLRGDVSERDVVWDQRACEHQDSLIQRVEYCKRKTPFKSTQRHSRRTLPLMLTSQLFSTLRSLSVPVLQLDDEVDCYIGALVHELNPLCVFSGDTDFAVTDGIPVVMDFDVPWDAMLFGWAPFAPATPSGSGGSPRSEVNNEPMLRLHILEAVALCAYLGLTSPDELYVAASLCGNDITSHTAESLQRSLVRPSKASQSRRPFTILDAAREVKQLGSVACSGDQLSPIMLSSVQRYRNAALRRPYAPTLEPQQIVVLQAILSDQLPPSLVGIIRSGCCYDSPMPLLDGAFGFVHDLFTFHRLRHALAFILGRTSITVHERGERKHVAKILPTPEPADETPKVLVSEGPRHEPICLPEDVMASLPATWNSSKDRRNLTAEQKVMAIGPLFTMFPGRGLSLLPRPTSGSTNREPQPPPSCVQLLLWVLHAGCTSAQELRRVTEMMVLIHFGEAGGEHACQHPYALAARSLVRSLPDHTASASRRQGNAAGDERDVAVLKQRPSVRTLELAHLFTSAYSSTRTLLQLLRLENDIKFPEPADVFSGTLLHVLSYASPLTREGVSHVLSSTGTDCAVRNEFADIVLTAVEELCADFVTTFERIQYRLPNDKGIRSIRVDRVYQWAGLLQQREEMVDALEAGGTSGSVLTVPADLGMLYAHATTTTTFAATSLDHPAAIAATAASTGDTLPIDEHIPAILSAIDTNRVICVQGDTGCGKSSMIPLHLYRDAVKRRRHVRIVVTQPRRLAAVALAKRVAHLLGEDVGQTVGYRLGGSVREESSRTRIYFITAGYLLESLVHSSNLWSRTTHLLLDEVHERSLDADMLSLVVRLMLQHDDQSETSSRRLHAKRLIVMSATIQAEMFMNYFMPLQWRTTAPKQDVLNLADEEMTMPLLHVGGRRMHVEELYLPDVLKRLQGAGLPQDVLADLDNYHRRVERARTRAAFTITPQDVRAVCALMMACVKAGTCILVFLPGLKEIEDCFEELSSQGTRSPVNLRVHALHSIIDGDEQARVLHPASLGECKIVLSTNIAETSITIPDVKVVIDMGFARRVVYDEVKRLQCIQCVWCSRAAAKQRSGRAGRVSNGLVLRLYTQSTMETIMPDFEESDCFPLEAAVLKVRQHLGHYGDVVELMQQLVEPPSDTMVRDALSRLVEWGALGPAPDYRILELGEVATMLPIDVSLTKSVLLSSRFGCAADMLVIAAGLTLQRSPYRLPMRTFYATDYEFQQNVMRTFNAIQHFDQQRCNDLFQYLSIVQEAVGREWAGKLGKFCEEWNLNFRQVRTLMQTSKLLCRRLLAAEGAGKMQFTTEDRSAMSRLAEAGTAGKPSQFSFASLRNEGASELLQLALAQDVDRMVTARVESAMPKIKKLLEGAANNAMQRHTQAAWTITASTSDDIIYFDRVHKAVFDGGAAELVERLRCFGATDGTVFPVGHGLFAAAVRIPRPQPQGANVHPPSLLWASAAVSAICRMHRLHPSKKYNFCSARVRSLTDSGDVGTTGSAVNTPLSKPITAALVGRWTSVEFPVQLVSCNQMQLKEASSSDDDADGATYQQRARSSAHTQWLQQDDQLVNTEPLQLDRWSTVGMHASSIVQHNSPALGCVFHVMSTQSSLLASAVFMINTSGAFPLVMLLASRRALQFPPLLSLAVCWSAAKTQPPALLSVSTHVAAYDRILLHANTGPLHLNTLLEVNLARLLLQTSTKHSSDNEESHEGAELPAPEAIVRALAVIRANSCDDRGHRTKGCIYEPSVAHGPFETKMFALSTVHFASHPQLVLIDLMPLVRNVQGPQWDESLHAYMSCVNGTAADLTALARPLAQGRST